MTEPQAVIGFDQLHAELSAVATGTYELALGQVAGDLAGAVQDLLGLALLKVEALKVPEIDNSHIRLTGLVRIPVRRGRTADIAVEAWFTRAGSGMDYTFAFAPAKDALAILAGDLRRVLDLLPVGVDDLWFTLSSIDVAASRIAIPGRELADVAIVRGRGILFRLEGRLLDLLQLGDTVFYLAGLAQPLRFETKLDVSARIGHLLTLQVSSITVNGADSITLFGQAAFRLFDGELVFDTALGLTSRAISLNIPVPQEFVASFNRAMFQPLVFSDAVVRLSGTVSSYAVGLSGRFKIKGSGNGGAFLAMYAAGNVTPIPDLFELQADRLTLSDAVTVMAGAPIALPSFLDRIVTLEQTYLYYTDRPNLPTLSGVPSVPGAKVHSNVTLLGYKAYGEFSSVPDGFKAKLLLAPIKLGTLIEIKGKAAGSPKGYRGNSIGAKAIQLEIDGVSRQAVASIDVSLFGQASVGCVATLSENAMDFAVDISLPPPLGTTRFIGALTHQSVALAADFRTEVGVDAEWGYGRMKIAKAAQVEGKIKVVAGPASATGSCDVRVSLGPVSLAFGLSFDPGHIDKLPQMIRDEVIKRVLDALKQVTVWLEAVLDGTIEFVIDVANTAEWIAYEMRDTFKVVGKEAVIALKKAGYTFNKAYLVLNEIEEVALRRVMDVMSDAAAYTEQEVIEWFKTITTFPKPEFTARMVAELLLDNGMSPERVIEEVQKLVKDVPLVAEVLGQLRRPIFEVVEFLQEAKIDAAKAAELLVRAFWQINKQVVAEALKGGGYAVSEATQAAENIFRESGRFAENVRDEVRRSWDRYKPEITIRW
jgi:hypothetical protein